MEPISQVFITNFQDFFTSSAWLEFSQKIDDVKNTLVVAATTSSQDALGIRVEYILYLNILLVVLLLFILIRSMR